MSRASKLSLVGTSVFAVATVILVHFQQDAERKAMHEGVIRDMEQQRIKKERQLDFEMQQALEAEYKKDQSIHDAIAAADAAAAAAAATAGAGAAASDKGKGS